MSPTAREWATELKAAILTQLRERPRPLVGIERRWPVTRRHVEVLVAELLDEGLVTWRPAPAVAGGRILVARQAA